MLNEKEIIKFCEINGYDCNYFGSNAIITTGVDQWNVEYAQVYSKHKKGYVDGVKLKHMNSRGNRSGKAHYHKQRYTSNINHAFQTITSHQENFRDFNKAFKIKNIIANKLI